MNVVASNNSHIFELSDSCFTLFSSTYNSRPLFINDFNGLGGGKYMWNSMCSMWPIMSSSPYRVVGRGKQNWRATPASVLALGECKDLLFNHVLNSVAHDERS